eukprot:2337306-Alexandrium_andersonii.AAC.1
MPDAGAPAASGNAYCAGRGLPRATLYACAMEPNSGHARARTPRQSTRGDAPRQVTFRTRWRVHHTRSTPNEGARHAIIALQTRCLLAPRGSTSPATRAVAVRRTIAAGPSPTL